MNKWLILFLALLGLLGLKFSYSKRSDCFSPDFAKSDLSFQLGSDPLSPEISAVLQQSFHFLGSGNQAYAFESKDQNYVLKLFKFHCLKNLHAKSERLKQGLLIANSFNKEHSGIIYLHFPPTPAASVHLQDKAGRKHVLPLDDYVFVLQEKARTLGDILKEKLKAADRVGAKEKLGALFRMLREDLNQGIYDRDHNVIANTGFVKDKPIRIDFGKLALVQEINVQRELKKIAEERILPWTKKNFPQFEHDIAQYLEDIRTCLKSSTE